MADASTFQSELYKAAVKRSSADLISELAVAFPHNSSLERIHALTRAELLDTVIQTRTRLNSLSAIRQVVNGGEKPPELFALVGVPTGGSTIAEQGGAVHVTTVTTSTSTTAVVVTTAAMIGTQTVTSPQQVQPSLPGVHVSRPAVSGVVTTPAIQQTAGHVQPSGGAPDMSGFGGIAQILAMMNAQNAQLATQSAERDASLKLQLAKLAQASEEKERMAKERENEKERVAREREAAMQLELAKMQVDLKTALVKETKDIVERAQDVQHRELVGLFDRQAIEARNAAAVRNESKAERVSRAFKQLDKIQKNQNDSPSQLSDFFLGFKRNCDLFEIKQDIRHIICKQFLSNRAKGYLERLPLDEIDTFEKVEHHLLKLYKVTASRFKESFDSATKRNDESYKLFASRLGGLLHQYLKS